MSEKIAKILSDEADVVLGNGQAQVLDKIIVWGAKIEQSATDEQARIVARTCVVDVSRDHISKTLDLPDVITRKFSEFWTSVTDSKFRSYLKAIATAVNSARPLGTSSVDFDTSPGTKYVPSEYSISDLYYDVLGQLVGDHGGNS